MDVEPSKKRVSSSSSSKLELDKASVVISWQRAFTHMLESCNGVYDLNLFTELLGLDRGVQQDPQEFNKLFLTKIENFKFPLRDSSRPSFTQLLTGKEKHSTICRQCKMERGQEHIFYEVDISISGQSNLADALQSHQSIESLSCDNKCQCDNCEKKTEADRCTSIVTIPTVLCVQLLRYIYDRATLEKKKLSSDFSFPELLIVNGEEYKLVSVLYHLGRSAHGGHYVAEVREWESDSWWHCDDDSVRYKPFPLPIDTIHSTKTTLYTQCTQYTLYTQIASNSRSCLQLGKRTFNRQLEMGVTEAYSVACGAMVDNMNLPDAQEGIRAFLEKRPPDFKD